MTEIICPTEGVIVLDKIPVSLDAARGMEFIKSAGSRKRTEDLLKELIEIVMPVVRPKVMYRPATVTAADGRRLAVDGIEFNHHVPALNFQAGERVFPYVATCGLEVEAIKFPNDMMKTYCLNALKTVILMQSVSAFFEKYLKETYHLTEVSRMGPGEAMGDTSQHRKIFALLGDVEGMIGVTVSPHNLMVPEKSASGIYFETAIKIESCQLCPNDCKARRAAYDPGLFEKFRNKASDKA
jgi:hypothetical protein